ncbi:MULTISPECIES: PilZ domain-containing protein [unclassified Thalassotalea]|uniref:PilZ domain-containing protein n=1 Tax=unclassified Thalassotalea TaxID=2614972 RepID=UPI001080AC75|nr:MULTISPECIES: PilZ domain-containing protein [unclassified Thalassotalea]NMP17410.1 PilZ domain-containing protein [Thalassotalea sp. Y01]QBY02879.1 PilZ domain-containing protein [Thalassotalea sp. HSM 43]
MHKFEQGFDDHRMCFRTMVNQEITITLIDEESSIDTTANCRDISETGLALEIGHPVDIGTIIKIHLDNDDQMSVPLTDCRAKVVRCEQENNDLFVLAAQIIDTE